MSVHRLVEVRCDGLDGEADCPDGAAWTGQSTPEVRSRMRGDGWATGLPGGEDRCPKCRALLAEQVTR